jgi:hypothetical protein
MPAMQPPSLPSDKAFTIQRKKKMFCDATALTLTHTDTQAHALAHAHWHTHTLAHIHAHTCARAYILSHVRVRVHTHTPARSPLDARAYAMEGSLGRKGAYGR